MNAVHPIQLLTPDGELVENETYSPYLETLDDNGFKDLYRHMALERRFDNEATSLQRQGQLALWAPALGQEAAQIGTIAALKETDMVFPTYREHAMALYRGTTPEELITLFRGVAHSGWNPEAHNFHLYTLVLGAQLPHAVGWAMGIKQDRRRGLSVKGRAEDEIVLACLGDGASSQGDVHESMVFASSYDLPVLYFIQNNHWAISVPSSTQSKGPLADRAQGYGFEGIRVDGNDVLASYAAASYMAEQLRSGSGPKLIESVTYRVGAHTTADDPTKYRGDDEVARWKSQDPLARYRRWLEESGKADESFFDQVTEDGENLASELRKSTAQLLPVSLEEAFDNVYTEPHRQIEVERNWLKEYEAGFEEEAGGEA